MTCRKYYILVFCLLIPLSTLFGQQDEDIIPLDYSAPREYAIADITVSGVQHMNEDVIITLSGLSVGDVINIPGERIARAIKDLWEQGLFANVDIQVTRVEDDEVYLLIKLQERPRLSKFRIEGVRKGEADDIRDKIRLVRGKVITKNTKIRTRQITKDYLVGKGYLNAKVSLREEVDTSLRNNVILYIDIHKGARVKVKEIRFTGNEAAGDGKLRRVMEGTKEKARLHILRKEDLHLLDTLFKQNPANWLNPAPLFGGIYDYLRKRTRLGIFKASKFLEDKYRKDKARIIEYYNTIGYRDAKITHDTVFPVDKHHLVTHIHIDEGNQYYFRDIEWKGNTKYDDKKLNEVLNIKKGEIYNQQRLQMRLFADPQGRDISTLYMDEGYLFFQVTPVEKTVHNDSIDLEIRVYEGPQATIDEIRIAGNTKTNEHVVRRELRTLPGDKFSRSAIIRSQREIANLGFFNQEKIDISPDPNPEEGTVDIEYRVEEQPSDQLELSAGYGAGRLVGTLGLSFNNFSMKNIFNKEAWNPLPSGDGQRLSIRAQSMGRFFQSLNTSFTEPWFGGRKPNSFTVSIFASRQSNGRERHLDTNNGNIPNPEYQGLTTIGFSVAYGIRLSWPDDFFTLRTTVEYQRFNVQNWRLGFFLPSGTANNISLQVNFARNSIDQPTYPRQGSKFELTAKATPPFSMMDGRTNADYERMHRNDNFDDLFNLLEYHRYKFDAEWYTSLVGNLVLKARSSFGFLNFYNRTIGYPPFERFELGGDGISNFQLFGVEIVSMRGYDPLDANPSTLEQETAPIFNKFTMELRYPLTLQPMSTIFGLAFIEGGNVWPAFDDFTPFQIRRSAGIGIRAHLPMFGLLGVDYGIGFDKPDIPGQTIWDKGRFNFILGFEPY